MTAVGFLSGAFVRRTGDTMTGDLNIIADLDVTGAMTGTYEGVTGDVVRLLSTALSTGVVSGGEFSPNADPTKLDISATTGWIVNYNSTGVISATNPQLTFVSIPAQVALTPVVGVPNGVTWWLIDSTGTVIQQVAKPSPTQRRTHLVLGATAQVSGVIVVDQSLPVIQAQPGNQIVDLMDSLGPFNVSGNKTSPNGANLLLSKNAGEVFARAFSQIPTYQDPHIATLSAQAPVTFRHITAVPGGAGALTTTLNVGSYDPGGAGVVTPVGGGANSSTNFRIWGFANNSVTDQILIQYGQTTYANLAAAVAAIGTTSFIPSPTAVGSGVLLGWVSVTRTATNLSDPAQAVVSAPAGKFATP